MKKIAARLVHSGLFFLGLTFLCGCIRDHLDCAASVSLKLTYVLNPDWMERFEKELEIVDVRIYNETEELIHRDRKTKEELDKGNLFSLPLSVGEYTAVIWGNLKEEDYTCEADESLQSMRVSLQTETGNTVTGRQSALFHGLSHFRVTGSSLTDTVSLTKNTNDIHIILQGVPSGDSSSGATGYTVLVTGSNGTYTYDNTKAVSEQLHYMPSYPMVSGTTQADFRVMRLMVGDNVRVSVRRDGEQILYESLTALLLEAPHINTNEDLDRYDDYSLTFNLEEDSGNLVLTSIEVEDWKYVVNDKGI